MEILKELSYISTYRPQKGDLLKLFQLLIEEGEDRDVAATKFGNMNYFRVIYKQLKDHLLDGILTSSFSRMSKEQQLLIKIQKRSLECHLLFQSGKNKAGVKIAEETILQAERNDLLHAALGLSSILELHYSSIQLDRQKRKKYQLKTIELLEAYQQEIKARTILGDLSFYHQKNQIRKAIPDKIAELEELADSNNRYRFRVFYYAAKNLCYKIAQQEDNVINNSKEAITFFESIDIKQSYISEFSFRYQLIPIYMKRKEYGKAEYYIIEALKLPTPGEYNWNMILLQKAVLGFYSSKLLMTREVLKMVKQTKNKFDSKIIESRWEIMQAYLYLFATWGKLQLDGKFRLYRFLNSVEVTDMGKPNLLILELLHLLVKGNKKEYMRISDGINDYIGKHIVKGNRRTRFFLRMLRAVELGDYHPVRVAAHAKKYKRQLYSTTPVITANVLDQEPVPYEMLWEGVMEWLSRR